MGNTRKFHNVAANGQVAFVVDDLASVTPWVVRGIEIRGAAEALTDQSPPNAYMSREVIRIHPRRVIAWGLGPDGGRTSRQVAPAEPAAG
jgi:pyridoxamine 5'-phosphate oxidase family protein